MYPGTNTIVATNGAEALARFNQQQPDLIISDEQMPIATDLSLVHTLRAQGATAPILILSSDPSIAEVVLTAGANQFLLKHFSVSVFRQIARSLPPIAPDMITVGFGPCEGAVDT
jgi:CheY-like chemotaxis protein